MATPGGIYYFCSRCDHYNNGECNVATLEEQENVVNKGTCDWASVDGRYVQMKQKHIVLRRTYYRKDDKGIKRLLEEIKSLREERP